MNESSPLKLAVIGAGPVGLALALHAAEALPDAAITLFDARPIDRDVAPIRARSRSRSAACNCCSGWAPGAPRARNQSARCTSRSTRHRCSRPGSSRWASLR